jgi:multidrug efflux pump subunit AcrA (membrane-fusion protein)
MMKKHLPLAIGIVLAVLCGCNDKIEPGVQKQAPPVVKDVSVSVARMEEKPLIYEGVGTVTAGISSNLAAKLLGEIREIRVREGDRVQKGDVLLVIDQRRVDAGVQKARAGLSEARKAQDAAESARKAAQTNKELNEVTYRRHKDLRDKKLISQQRFDEVEAQYRQAEADLNKARAMVDAATARVNQAEAGLSEVRVTQKDTVITAPHDGIISKKMADAGDMASPGAPLLTLETVRGFCVDMTLPETYVDFVRPMQSVTVRVPALKTGPLEGTVCTVVPGADPKSRSFVVKINLPIDMEVRSGMFARVEIPTGRQQALLIPRTALVERGQLTGIYLLDDQNTVRFRLIRTGKVHEEQIEVLSGLKAGDRYVPEPSPNLKDGVRVEVSS